MVLAVVRHAESIENADKYRGFYYDRRPYNGQVAHQISRKIVGLTPRGFRQSVWLGQEFADLAGPDLRVYTSTYRRAIDTAELAFPDLADDWSRSTALLDEHCSIPVSQSPLETKGPISCQRCSSTFAEQPWPGR